MSTALTPIALHPIEGLYELATRPAEIYLDKTLGPGSRRTMEQALNVIAGILTEGRATARTCPWAALRYDFTAGLPAQLKAKGYERASINKMLSALRGVLLEAWRLELLDHDTMRRAGAIRPPKGEGLTPVAGRAIAAGELRALFEACAADTNRSAGDRDSCAIALLYGSGLRRSELVAIVLGDHDPASGALRIRHGKGDKARMVYVAITYLTQAARE
jgi:site-specific recombinase XerD